MEACKCIWAKGWQPVLPSSMCQHISISPALSGCSHHCSQPSAVGPAGTSAITNATANTSSTSAPVPLHRQRWQLVQGLLFCLLHGGSAQQTRWHMVVVMRGRCCCGMATLPLRAGAGPYPGSMPTASGASWCHCDVTSNVSHSSPSLLSLPSFPRLKPLIRNLFSHQF